MKTKLALIIILFSCFWNVLNADDWLTSMEDAKKLALGTNKLILVDFWATWCGPCKKMDADSWSKDEVKELMDYYVPVKIDIDRNRSLAQAYGVQGIPYIFILDGNGKVLYQEMRYKGKRQVIALLKKYALSTEFLGVDLINYFKSPGFNTAFRLGTKYQDYALYLNKELKRDFLQVAKKYFDEAKKYMKDSKMENETLFDQKFDLFEIQELLVLNKPEKALKQLGKFKEVEQGNQALFNFLNYTSHRLLNDNLLAEWEQKITDTDKSKAELFIEEG